MSTSKRTSPYSQKYLILTPQCQRQYDIAMVQFLNSVSGTSTMNIKGRVAIKFPAKSMDQKWQRIWEERGLNQIKDPNSKPKWYELTMYPYPSGDLHIGHWYAMAPADAHARFRRMQGYNVLHPMGFDAFGLPAENAAIRKGVHPKNWTMDNINRMRSQLKSMGAIYDWDREVICCLPDYYKWNQWMFLQMFKNGLAYRTKAPVVWCPSCQTVLANEQVLNGVCERCETPVTHRDLAQWFLKITQYAEELLDFSGLVHWPARIITMQQNWIGKSQGVDISFDLSHLDLAESEIKTFTTRIDTIFGVTFMVLAPEHPLVLKLTKPEQRPMVEEYLAQSRMQTEIERMSTNREKTGVFLGTYAENHVNRRKIPIYTADYVLTTYGTGAVMGVPGHDQRDHDFAVKFELPIIPVISPPYSEGREENITYTGEGIMINSERFNDLKSQDAKEAIALFIEENGWGERTISYRIRDWLISRQRYWGTPIPIIYCDTCGPQPVPEMDLPVLLPPDADFQPGGEQSPLATNKEFLQVACPICNGKAKRETDTMDTFIDSSWYMYRFTSPHYKEGPFHTERMNDWMPVDQYTGGAEHAVMHLLYARFFTKVLRDLSLVSFDEPFLRLFNQGTIIASGAKMSKSKGNVIAPDTYVDQLGADVVRTYLMFLGPWEQGGDWTDTGINGVSRWMNRLWTLFHTDVKQFPLNANETKTRRKLHKTIEKVHKDMDSFKFNTAIASLMEMTNELSRAKEKKAVSQSLWQECVEKVLLMLAPIAPHITEELWEVNGQAYSIHTQCFPQWDPSMTKEEGITLVIQINGKVRDKIESRSGISLDTAMELALSSEKIKPLINDHQIKKTIFVPDKLLNFVI